MSEKGLISIIVPIYNTEDYLRKCLESIRRQTYSKLQIILVDDGSTDNSSEICDEYVSKDNRFAVVHKKNEGQNIARRVGVELANGEYICFVDSDDWIDSEMLNEMINAIRKDDFDMVHFGVFFEYEQETSRDVNFDEEIIVTPGKNKKLLQGIVSPSGDYSFFKGLYLNIYKEELIKANINKIPKNINVGEDYLLVLHCILNSKKIALIKKAYYHYVQRQNSSLHIYGDKRIFETAGLYWELYEILIEHNVDSTILRKLKESFIQNILFVINRKEKTNIYIPKYIINNIEILQDRKVLLYGAGHVGRDFYYQLSKMPSIKIVGIVDKYEKDLRIDDINIKPLKEIDTISFDIILICVLQEDLAEGIKKELIEEYHIEKNIIIWEKPR